MQRNWPWLTRKKMLTREIRKDLQSICLDNSGFHTRYFGFSHTRLRDFTHKSSGFHTQTLRDFTHEIKKISECKQGLRKVINRQKFRVNYVNFVNIKKHGIYKILGFSKVRDFTHTFAA